MKKISKNGSKKILIQKRLKRQRKIAAPMEQNNKTKEELVTEVTDEVYQHSKVCQRLSVLLTEHQLLLMTKFVRIMVNDLKKILNKEVICSLEIK